MARLTKSDERLLRKLRDAPLETREELQQFIVSFLDVHLASVPLSPGHSSPMDFIWDVYRTAMLDDTGGKPTTFLGLANRGGQKTLTCSVLIMLLLHHDAFRDIIHMASIAPQSELLHNVWLNRHIGMPYMGEIFKDFSMKRTTTTRGPRLTITWGTMDAVNAHHGGFLIQDEVDLTDPTVFDESKGMLISQRGHSPINVMISSRKYAVGNIQNILDKIEEDPDYGKTISVHKWGQLETTRKCYPQRSGTTKTPIMVNTNDLIALSVADYNNLHAAEKVKYQVHQGYENCLKCGIFSFCLTRLQKQCDNIHLTPINDTVKFFSSENREFFRSQRLNYKPSTKGLIYPTYDPHVHDKSTVEMYKILDPTIKERDEKTIMFNDLIKLFTDLKIPICMGVDFGFNNMASELIAIAQNRDGLPTGFVIDELCATGLSDREFALETYNRWHKITITSIFPDIATPGGIKEFKKIWGSDIGVCTNTNKDIDYGLNLVRNMLLWPGTNQPHLFLHKINCPHLRHSMRHYRYKIDQKTAEPMDKIYKHEDHPNDAIRYPLATLLGKSPFTMSFGAEYNGTQSIDQTIITGDSREPLVRAPTGEELLSILGTHAPHGGAQDRPRTTEEEAADKKKFWWGFGG